MILCDLPYGTTACKWDSIIPFEPLWEQYERIIKDRCVIVLFASQPFTSRLISSNIDKFKYSLVWDKKKAGNILLAKKQPMKVHEDICVFYDDVAVVKGKSEKFRELRDYFISEKEKSGLTSSEIAEVLGNQMGSRYFTKGIQWTLPTLENYKKLQSTGYFSVPYEDLRHLYEQIEREIGENRYYPQMKEREKVKRSKNYGIGEAMGDGIKASEKIYEYTHTYPTSILEFSNANQKGKVHPTQKPVALFEYLIRTYTNEGEIVLDNCIGSGTTAVAAINTNRQFIGIEKEPEYVEIGNRRIAEALAEKEAGA